MNEQGAQGTQGARGAQGPSGGQGIEGPLGPEGQEGPRGPGGVTGDTGVQGDRGKSGRMPRSVAIVYVITAIVITVALSLIVFTIRENRQLAREGEAAHDALCVFKQDLQRRADSTARYIDDVRHGRRLIIQGLTLAELDRSHRSQQAAISSLDLLDCK